MIKKEIKYYSYSPVEFDSKIIKLQIRNANLLTLLSNQSCHSNISLLVFYVAVTDLNFCFLGVFTQDATKPCCCYFRNVFCSSKRREKKVHINMCPRMIFQFASSSCQFDRQMLLRQIILRCENFFPIEKIYILFPIVNLYLP